MTRYAVAALVALVSSTSVFAQAQDSGSSEVSDQQRRFIENMNKGPQHEAFKIFDNLYYVGINFVSAYVIPTSEGLILIDGTFDTTVDHLLKGVRDLGFDPKDIRYILVTHWHLDHYDGAPIVQKLSGATVGMIQEDWDGLSGEPDVPKDKRLVIQDGSSLTLGDTTLNFYHLPGHTLGTLGISFKVYDNGTPHKAFTYGGVGLNFSGVRQSELYVQSVKRVMGLDGIEVNVANHEFQGGVFKRAETLAQRKPGDPHPFVAPGDFQEFLVKLLKNGEKKLKAERKKAQEQ